MNVKSQKGFTFIELILYISIVTIMLSAIIPFAWNVIGVGVKSSNEQEVFSQARYVSERIKYEIRSSTGRDAANSNFDVNLANNPAQKLRLTEEAPVNTLDISVTSAGLVQLDPGNDVPYTINSSDTKVTNLTFTDYTSFDSKTKHIQFSLTIGDTGTSSRQEYQVPAVSIQGSAEVRSN